MEEPPPFRDRGRLAARREEKARPGPPRFAFSALVAALVGLLAVSVTLAVMIGSVSIPASRVWEIALHHVVGLGPPADWTTAQDQIVWQIRFPRVLLAVVVGAGLAVVGAILQALVRNPLVHNQAAFSAMDRCS